MIHVPFKREDLLTVSEALDIAEDRTADYLKFSSGQWRRHRYDVKTLSQLTHYEVIPDVFALLKRSKKRKEEVEPNSRHRDFYFICLQDHRILKALKRDRELGLLPLLVYVFTHELVHIVRFCNFSQRFEVSTKDREKEERIVHTMTFEILKELSLPRLDYILDSYETHRVCDMVEC
ncbi:MAG: hypothetical protein H6Q48_1308 [Deltaproteobacteria bacterium]|nr:hypothetical protein [Deltaproteobacteria bacterium]